MTAQDFSVGEVLSRRARLLAHLLRDHWEEKSGFDTRFFERPFIHDHMIWRGRSTNGGGYREHIVPRIVIRDGCLSMLSEGASIDELRHAIIAHLGIVEITPEEAQYLDHKLKLKIRMPEGWRFGIDDPLARIKAAEIEIVDASFPLKRASESCALAVTESLQGTRERIMRSDQQDSDAWALESAIEKLEEEARTTSSA